MHTLLLGRGLWLRCGRVEDASNGNSHVRVVRQLTFQESFLPKTHLNGDNCPQPDGPILGKPTLLFLTRKGMSLGWPNLGTERACASGSRGSLLLS